MTAMRGLLYQHLLRNLPWDIFFGQWPAFFDKSKRENEDVLEASLYIANRMGVSLNLIRLRACHMILPKGTLHYDA